MAVEEGKCLAWGLFFLALHDLGKIDIRFQLKAREVLLRLQPDFGSEDAKADNNYFHGPSGWEWFVIDPASIGLGERELVRWGEWMRAVCGHHGSLSLGGQFSRPLAEDLVIEFDATAMIAWVQYLETFFLRPAGLTSMPRLPKCPDLFPDRVVVVCWRHRSRALPVVV
jgi:CRISPR-associated endonuclease/helicase Cas3